MRRAGDVGISGPAVRRSGNPLSPCSTETRKLVKDEERIVHFLDQKGMVRQRRTAFVHGKADACRVCTLDPICAGLYGLGEAYDGAELYPVFLDPAGVAARVRADGG